jgi:hypothetical protein
MYIQVASLLGPTAQNALDGISKNGLGDGIHHRIFRGETREICLLAYSKNQKKFL